MKEYRLSQTMLEGILHFKKSVKEDNLKEALLVFIPFIEAVSSLQSSENVKNNEKAFIILNEVLPPVEEIARLLEDRKSSDILEIVQFNLEPKVRGFMKAMDTQNESKDYVIGVYYPSEHPKDVYDLSRLNALNEEANRQGARMILFESKDVNFEKQKIDAVEFSENRFKAVVSNFPDVIYNLSPEFYYAQTLTERRLRKVIPFTSHSIGNKLTLPKKISRYSSIANLFVPFLHVTSVSLVDRALDEYGSVVLKPIVGARGEGIYFIERKENLYKVYENDKVRLINYLIFKTWIEELIAHEGYLVQPYIKSITNNGEPYDIRAHMQKDKHGKWVLTKIYPRIGKKGSILSNFSKGGSTVEFKTFLQKKFGDEKNYYEKLLIEKSFEIALEVDKSYRMSVDEVGIDLTVDDQGRLWLYEVNPGPQSTLHEKERAVHSIGYALYLAKNQIFYTNDIQEDTGLENQFSYFNDHLQQATLDESKITIGMFINDNEDDRLTKAAAYIAHYEGCNFYTFKPEDIDLDKRVIRGSFLEGHVWVEKSVRYPDVVYDRLRYRGILPYQLFYDTFDFYGIEMSNPLPAGSLDKYELYEILSSNKTLHEHQIPYWEVLDLREVLRKAKDYKKIILKPKEGAFALGLIFIEFLEGNTYKWSEGEETFVLTQTELLNKLSLSQVSGSYVGQKFIESKTKDGKAFDLRIYVGRNKLKGSWEVLAGYSRVGTNDKSIARLDNGGTRGKLKGFLKRNRPQFSDRDYEELEKYLIEAVRTYTHNKGYNLFEVAFDVLIDKEGKFYLIEMNTNKPGTRTVEVDIARNAILYCKDLVESRKKL